jgi:hypothetical protein
MAIRCADRTRRHLTGFHVKNNGNSNSKAAPPNPFNPMRPHADSPRPTINGMR